MIKKLLAIFVFFGCFFFLNNACTCDSSEKVAPEKTVEAYLDVALNMKELTEKEDLLELTTGSLKAAIAAANDDVIRDAYLNKKYSIKSYSVVERRDRTPREVEITFQLTYQDLGTKENPTTADTPATTTTENTVVLVKEKKVWRIQEVLGHKTTLDFPVSDDSKITAKPAAAP